MFKQRFLHVVGVLHRMKTILTICLLALFGLGLAFAQWQMVESRFENHLTLLVDATNGVLTGHPHWTNYQNRVLGPMLYGAIRRVTHRDDERAFSMTFVLLLWLFFCVQGTCAWQMTRSVSRTAMVLLAGFALNALLMQPPWLYLWDAVDLTVFSVLAWALLTRQPLRYIAAAVAVEIFNRDMGLLLALVLFCEGVWEWRTTRKWTRATTGLALLLGGFLIIKAIQRAMFISAVLPGGMTITHADAAAMPLFWQNFCDFARFVGRGENFIRDLPRWLAILAIVVQFGRDGMVAERRRAVLWLGAIFAAVWVLGYAMEWRVWLDFMPYLALSLGVEPRSEAEKDAALRLEPPRPAIPARG